MQRGIPCAIMRGGTSKGIYFLREDLPADDNQRNALILKLVGGDARQVNGLGGGDMLSAKVAVVSAAQDGDADIDYRFVQVLPGKNTIDTSPTCGNILAGVGAFAIEKGLIKATHPTTQLLVRDINTGARVEQEIQTPNGAVCYDGSCLIDGVSEPAAPVMLYYLDFIGIKTGALLPTQNATDTIDGVNLTCIDAAMPTLFANAQQMGIKGDEAPADLQKNQPFMEKLEKIRLQGAQKMGLGDARGKVIPKFATVSQPAAGGNICARYFTPVTAHAAFAVSGGIALASAMMTPNTTVHNCARLPALNAKGNYDVVIEHPSGTMTISLKLNEQNQPHKAGVLRTTRLIMMGDTYLAGL